MCSTSACDLEEVPLDDDDPNSMEFKILAFYVKHHAFKATPPAFSPKMQRTRSLSQSWSVNESWAQMSWPCRNSRSSEKAINLGKKKSSWKSFFGVEEKEEDAQSPPTQLHAQGPRIPAGSSGPHTQHWFRSLSNMGQHVEQEAVDPEVVSIANRVAEIVHSWPPPEETHYRGGKFKSKQIVVRQGLYPLGQCSQPRFESESAVKDGDDQIIAKIVELLKYSGDQLERELKKDKDLMNSFQDGLSYSVFKTITDQFLSGVDTRGESEVKAQGFKAALAIDVAAKLTAIDNHPMNRVLGFGTKYLKENFSPWVQQHGGWEKILGISHEEVD
ncbi:apoptosis facilitator Bcl-2-like protein 14 isoform X2 [Dasypus novemcinctus]|uniref:apoptosis facilitator Bcl-2-like protein 14 isoform X2 n=1 Tax=Dasypus novemcinctus TaxID=9361 RepID=UPI00032884A1|nr:apoptosis facilitator Bcl-2-like protein 14 isoform X2 [Dasypus novemcinctus]